MEEDFEEPQVGPRRGRAGQEPTPRCPHCREGTVKAVQCVPYAQVEENRARGLPSGHRPYWWCPRCDKDVTSEVFWAYVKSEEFIDYAEKALAAYTKNIFDSSNLK